MEETKQPKKPKYVEFFILTKGELKISENDKKLIELGIKTEEDVFDKVNEAPLQPIRICIKRSLVDYINEYVEHETIKTVIGLMTGESYISPNSYAELKKLIFDL
jgi:hypothetical protein